MLQILDTGVSAAAENMRCDAELLDALDPAGEPILHLYDWAKPSATYGYFVRPEEYLIPGTVDFARRPTGGGIVFHIWDLAFSFLMPSNHPHFSLSTLGNYEFVNSAVLKTVQSYFSLAPELILKDGVEISAECQNFCMAKPTQYDVVYQGKKIAGAAQRRRKQGYLHQGTISLCSPDVALLKAVLLSKEDVVRAMQTFTFAPVKSSDLAGVRLDLQKLLAAKLREALNS
jgi:lipoate-protein ligase A